MKTYDYPKSRELFERAVKVIPCGVYGHQGPAEGCMIPTSCFPFFSSRAEDTRFWDVDGNEFIDYMCAYGPNVLGYNDPDVDAAAAAQRKLGDCVTSPNSIMVDYAELLCKTVERDWAFFCKNGADTTLFAVMIARYHTGRKKIMFNNGYYHGTAPWSQNASRPGTLDDECKNNILVKFNDVDSVKRAIEKNKGQIAAFIAAPYMQGNFIDNELPNENYWKEVRRLCTENGIVLIIDDVRCGFRLSLKGSDQYYGFKADLICFCKALANGYNVSCLMGLDFMKPAASAVTYTGSYWMSAVPFAAGIACLKKMIALDTPKLFREQGTKLKNGLIEAAKAHGVNLVVSGEPAMFYLRIADDDSLLLHQEWVSECVRRGLFITNHHNHFINACVTDEIIAKTIEIANEAFDVLVKNHPEVYGK